MTKNHNHNQNLNQPYHKIKQNFFLRKSYPLPPLSQSKKLITNHVDVNGPTKLFLVRLINFHTRTHIVTWIALRRAERKRERERSRLPDETESHQNGRESVHWFPDLLEPGWQASSLLPGLFQDRRVSRSHTCIINETCHAARAINFDVQIRSDTDATLTTKRHTLHAQTFRNAAATRAA